MMMFRRRKFTGVRGPATVSLPVAVATFMLAAVAHGQYSGRQPADAAGLEITECVVYRDFEAARRHDCTAKAKELCSNSARSCELPIGLALSGGRDIDGNPQTWEKVRVRYRCGGQQRINGPHHQNDHASMILSCLG